MKNKRVSTLIIILLVMLLGSMVYHVYFRDGETIYIQSYDRESTFILGEYKTERIIESIDEHSNEVLFWIDDDEEFINEFVLNHESYITTYHYKHNSIDEEYDVYYFIEEGYGYSLSVDINGVYALRPSTINIYNEDIEVISQFIPCCFIGNDTYYDFNDMNTENFLSFEDYVEFYQQISCDCSVVDYENKRITLRSYNYDLQEIDLNYQIVLQFDDKGFIATIEEIN